MADRYRIILQPEAIAGMEDAYRWILSQSKSLDVADRWIDGLATAIQSLETFPGRCPKAPISDAVNEDIRMFVYGKRNSAYLILFTIDKDEVHVLHVRHSARDWAV